MGISQCRGIQLIPIAVSRGVAKSPRRIGPTGSYVSPQSTGPTCSCSVPTTGFLHSTPLQLSGPDYSTVERQMVLSKNCILDVTVQRAMDGYTTARLSAIYRARLDDLLRLLEESPP